MLTIKYTKDNFLKNKKDMDMEGVSALMVNGILVITIKT